MSCNRYWSESATGGKQLVINLNLQLFTTHNRQKLAIISARAQINNFTKSKISSPPIKRPSIARTAAPLQTDHNLIYRVRVKPSVIENLNHHCLFCTPKTSSNQYPRPTLCSGGETQQLKHSPKTALINSVPI